MKPGYCFFFLVKFSVPSKKDAKNSHRGLILITSFPKKGNIKILKIGYL